MLIIDMNVCLVHNPTVHLIYLYMGPYWDFTNAVNQVTSEWFYSTSNIGVLLLSLTLYEMQSLMSYFWYRGKSCTGIKMNNFIFCHALPLTSTWYLNHKVLCICIIHRKHTSGCPTCRFICSAHQNGKLQRVDWNTGRCAKAFIMELWEPCGTLPTHYWVHWRASWRW